ncbi:nitrate reductase [Marinobacter zhejiangensis]|uniref:Assimilatory nitrate reductase catalytic subunit n=1 Tax=Marinobacter zhejiangensis TaxID=488535 RepID=A0A1I4M162_9GAMM|nr:nitrate reductase [Marinobacter zhejiangensis]SFL96952.1 assimilatory nitrate reductase catalytic subunit [Marinobacter zhejiangensis]
MTVTSTDSCRTTCPYCGVGCGVLAQGGTTPSVAGDPAHPANAGRLCVKGANLHETTGHGGRLLAPKVAGRRVSWPDALTATSEAIRQAVAEHGPGSVAFYLSGQLLTEDYYVANKLAKGFIGTPHVDTNSRLCMSSAVAAHKRAFGADAVPGCYDDLELADLLVLVGSNAAWNHPVLYQRMKAAARDGRRVVVIDPRRTATSELADLHLSLRPGTDTVLFNGLLVWLADHQGVDQDYLSRHCDGYELALAAARDAAPDLGSVARQCDLAEAEVETFYRWFLETPRTVTGFSQGANQSVAGTDKGNAIINCHLATGRVGRPGASPFSLTGQPNAMGGREVGGLANTLAAHMDYQSEADKALVTEFWGSRQLADGPGLKAVDMFDAIHRGEIKVLWVMATNPAVSLPDTVRVREALKRCPTVIVSDCMADTDTTAYADILLPATGWGEKDGTVTNSERRISRQRGFLPPAGEARPDWWIISAVARQLGYGKAFDYQAPADVFREHAALSAFGNDGQRVFNLAGLATLGDDAYDTLAPIQWPVLDTAAGIVTGTPRLFADGVFCHPDGRARLVPIRTVLPVSQPDAQRPLVVNTGRVRDQWHTMTRTAKSARLLQHRAEPFIDVHPHDLQRFGVADQGLAVLENRGQRYIGRVRRAEGQRPGEVFVPIHWNQCYTGAGLASALTERITDPFSGQPESKYGLAALRPFPARWHARLLCRTGRPRRWKADYWSYVPLDHCDSWWLASETEMDWVGQADYWLGGVPQLVMSDPGQGRYRAARIVDGRLEAIILVDREVSRLPESAWLEACFSQDALSERDRRALLAARDSEAEDIGAIVCSCFQVGQNQIEAAIADGASSVAALGQQLRCGSNCGSCIPELKALVETLGEAVEP